jgi:N-methylhydantoinase B
MLIGLDLRAKIGANNVDRERLLALITSTAPTPSRPDEPHDEHAGARLRGKLRPADGSWSATGYQDQSTKATAACTRSQSPPPR